MPSCCNCSTLPGLYSSRVPKACGKTATALQRGIQQGFAGPRRQCETHGRGRPERGAGWRHPATDRRMATRADNLESGAPNGGSARCRRASSSSPAPPCLQMTSPAIPALVVSRGFACARCPCTRRSARRAGSHWRGSSTVGNSAAVNANCPISSLAERICVWRLAGQCRVNRLPLPCAPTVATWTKSVAWTYPASAARREIPYGSNGCSDRSPGTLRRQPRCQDWRQMCRRCQWSSIEIGHGWGICRSSESAHGGGGPARVVAPPAFADHPQILAGSALRGSFVGCSGLASNACAAA